MIRRVTPFLFAALVLGAFVWTLVFLYKRSEARPVVFETTRPERRDLVKKTVAPGALVPRREVVIKPRVSGVVEKLYVEPGQFVKEKALIAKIQIIPNQVSLNQAEANLRAAEISLQTAEQEYARYAQLRQQGLLNQGDMAQQELNFKLRREEREAAENNLQLVKSGASKKSGLISNLVTSTVNGTVLEVPVKEGASVIEANTFNEGTSIASIADMNDLIFDGRVDESEVGALREGMPVAITVGALGEERLSGKLEYIAPKGVEKEGSIQFEIKAAVTLKANVVLRANYSANADVILDQREHALALSESAIVWDGKKAFADVEVGPQRFERRALTLGLSDGIWVEVLGGVNENERVKKQDPGSDTAKGGTGAH